MGVLSREVESFSLADRRTTQIICLQPLTRTHISYSLASLEVLEGGAGRIRIGTDGGSRAGSICHDGRGLQQ